MIKATFVAGRFCINGERKDELFDIEKARALLTEAGQSKGFFNVSWSFVGATLFTGVSVK
ncbi:MAG: hypothetical protein ON057_001422 [Glomeribacter sp. 1016415]|uniref:Periplasmic dipeptide transport protein n=1 Tax=Mycoavidus cysteinexigens TaxID=1553431 RepID=A0A2Z6EWK2_9BURK|nr:hypothetical protein [Mycoavidus cysteinexigens]MCX8566695.1 hypothetical protein [Glomeribacter sp. 1016415]BBE09837.1 Putative periplasmic dipeptide transport protein [Mycoavidus cysteinexigens]GAM53819.1 hypothetical protein EBME_2282 [bacterium endosymbiont of Mortierella elongata FMR23-6]GLR01738.1 hypothetical protein GCM10007934_15500 [Mycoavidus cysteinexigens]